MGLTPRIIRANGGLFDVISQELRRLPPMIEKYADGKMPASVEAHAANLIDYLSKVKEKDNESGELLCYGYFVIADKK